MENKELTVKDIEKRLVLLSMQNYECLLCDQPFRKDNPATVYTEYGFVHESCSKLLKTPVPELVKALAFQHVLGGFDMPDCVVTIKRFLDDCIEKCKGYKEYKDKWDKELK